MGKNGTCEIEDTLQKNALKYSNDVTSIKYAGMAFWRLYIFLVQTVGLRGSRMKLGSGNAPKIVHLYLCI